MPRNFSTTVVVTGRALFAHPQRFPWPSRFCLLGPHGRCHPFNEPVNEPVTTYTEQGQRVLDLAKEEALSFNHHDVGAEHLLLGILREGSAAAPLVEQGTTHERVRAGLLFLVGKGQPDPDAGTPSLHNHSNPWHGLVERRGIAEKRRSARSISYMRCRAKNVTMA
jgi:hypothetical protein